MVSTVGLGCNNFGGRLDASATETVLNAALDAGITFWDTADVYGGTHSEEFIGKSLKKNKRRGDVVLATKFGIKLDDARIGGGSASYITKAVDDSLRRLQTDHIDLYQIHRPDPDTPIAETLGALNDLVMVGKVREVGCSNFSALQLQEAEDAAKANDLARFVSVQNHYSLLHREPETDGVLEKCEKLTLGMLPYFPLANGLLTGKYRLGKPFPEGTRLDSPRGREKLSEENLHIVEKLTAFAEARNHSLLELAFAWLLAEKSVASVIAGATSVEQIWANARAGAWQMTDAEKAEVGGLVPA